MKNATNRLSTNSFTTADAHIEDRITFEKATFYEQVLGVNFDLPSLGLLWLMLRRMLLSTEFLFALSVSFVDTGARCRLGFSRRVDAASYRTASLRAKVGMQSSEHGVVATGEHEQSSGGFCVEGHVRFLRSPDVMEQDGELACDGHNSSVLGLLASAFSQMEAPSTK